MGHQNTKSHAGHIQDPFGNNKAHREKQVGCRDERKDDQRQRLKETKTPEKYNKNKIFVLKQYFKVYAHTHFLLLKEVH